MKRVATKPANPTVKWRVRNEGFGGGKSNDRGIGGGKIWALLMGEEWGFGRFWISLGINRGFWEVFGEKGGFRKGFWNFF